MTTVKEIAAWMKEQIPEKAYLRQNRVANMIFRDFGPEYIYKNKNGNRAIRKDILDEFRDITGDEIVWSRSQQAWRKRQDRDPDGRMVR